MPRHSEDTEQRSKDTKARRLCAAAKQNSSSFSPRHRSLQLFLQSSAFRLRDGRIRHGGRREAGGALFGALREAYAARLYLA